MAAVLADLAIESEATTLAAFRLAGATDRAVAAMRRRPRSAAWRLAATKYWVCSAPRRTPPKRSSAWAARVRGRNLGCRAGLYREAPLASIWEGSGNVRGARRAARPDQAARIAEAFFAELDLAAGQTAGWTRR